MNTSALTSPSLFFRGSALTALILSGTVLALSGCAIDSITPDSAATATAASSVPTAPMAAIQGSDYGGHAPIVSAKVFVLEANPSATSYGNQVKSLIPSTVSGATLDSTSGSPTQGMYYVTTSSSGQLFITGDYTCDIGYPVYLYASGGNPQAQTVNQGAIQLTGASSYVNSSGNLVVTFTTGGAQPSLLYQGESITFNTFTDPSYGAFSNTTQTVASVNLTTSQFSVVLGAASSALPTETFSSYVTISQSNIQSNPAIANMAMLGVCGDTSPTNPTVTSTTNFSNLNFVFMNEVSTAATAYAMGGFFTTPTYSFTISVGSLTHNGVTLTTGAQSSVGTLTATDASTSTTVTITGAAISGTSGNYTITMSASGPLTQGHTLSFASSDSGTTLGSYLNGASGATILSYSLTSDALHMSVPSGHAQALLGLQNAARNAALLYDVQGSNVGTGSDGDTHIARSSTSGLGSYVGTATVPQATLDLVGNVLANCVDSGNTYNAAYASTGTASSQCTGAANTGLFYYATSDGTTAGVQPNDTATAAINIAHHPGSNATSLISTITGNYPFLPTLTSAQDLSVGLVFTTPGTNYQPYDISYSALPDQSGNIWLTTFIPGGLYEFSPQGALLNNNSPGEQYTYDIAFDSSGNVFTTQYIGVPNSGSATDGNGFFEYSSGTVTKYGDLKNYLEPYGIALDASDNVFLAQVGNGTLGNPPALDGTIFEFLKSNSYGDGTGQVKTISTCGGGVRELALDGVGNLWGPSQKGTVGGPPPDPTATIEVCRYNLAGATETDFTGLAIPNAVAIDSANSAWVTDSGASAGSGLFKFTSSTSSTPTSFTGGGLNTPNFVAIDGAGNAFVTNSGNNSLSQFSNTGTALSPATNGFTGITSANTSSYLSGPRTVAVDPSGNVWVANAGAFTVTEFVGIATPVITPLSNALKQGKIASKP